MNTSPVIVDMPENGVISTMTDGAYYVARGQLVQVVIVGPMHFTPGDYLDAINELLDSHYRLINSSFLTAIDENRNQEILCRGFVSLIASKGDN